MQKLGGTERYQCVITRDLYVNSPFAAPDHSHCFNFSKGWHERFNVVFVEDFTVEVTSSKRHNGTGLEPSPARGSPL